MKLKEKAEKCEEIIFLKRTSVIYLSYLTIHEISRLFIVYQTKYNDNQANKPQRN